VRDGMGLHLWAEAEPQAAADTLQQHGRRPRPAVHNHVRCLCCCAACHGRMRIFRSDARLFMPMLGRSLRARLAGARGRRE